MNVAEPAAHDPLIGATLGGRYQIVRRIGEGGMGAVYEAHHTVIGRKVAIKVLLERYLERRELVQRLLQEARLASSIGHENIVDVLDFGTTNDDRAFVVMEFLEGESLAALLAREAPLPVERALAIGCQIASALHAAHQKGIVHRDLKPENVFIIQRSESDFVKVVDFGVSKAMRGDEAIESLRLTRTGMLLGTPLYMSPEQARGEEDIDARADIWALGVLLYECLTGEVPFRANNYLQVIAQVLGTEIPPPSQLRPELGIPPLAEAAVMRALQKDRARRHPDMLALQLELERLLPGRAPAREVVPPRAAPEAARPVQGPRWYLGALAVALLGGSLCVALFQDEEVDPTPLRAPPPASIAEPVAAADTPRPAMSPTIPAPPMAPAQALAQPVGARPGAVGATRSGKPVRTRGPVRRPEVAPEVSTPLPARGKVQFRGDDQVLPTEKVYENPSRAP